MPTWFDAHLDLAYLAVNGRQMSAALEEFEPAGDSPVLAAVGPHPPAAVTLPSLSHAGVRFALGTIFTESGGTGPEGYPTGDAERAHAVGRAQLEAYLTWRDDGRVALDLRQLLRHDPGVGELRGGMGVAEPVPEPIEKRVARLPTRRTIHTGILIEGADPIRTPDELDWWAARGVVAIGMAWWADSRYARGNGADPSDQVGLTDLGRALAHRMDELAIVHDLSHLSQRASDELLALTDRPVIASHSNCRALLGGDSADGWQRHLSDDTIREIARRGGVIGLNLCANFIAPDIKRGDRPTVEQAIAHVDHICDVTGSRNHVGLGSDMDGGFSAEHLPQGIDTPDDLPRLLEALLARGWSDDDAARFAHLNWLTFFERFWAGAPSGATSDQAEAG
jgi:membrane dipeptidase